MLLTTKEPNMIGQDSDKPALLMNRDENVKKSYQSTFKRELTERQMVENEMKKWEKKQNKVY